MGTAKSRSAGATAHAGGQCATGPAKAGGQGSASCAAPPALTQGLCRLTGSSAVGPGAVGKVPSAAAGSAAGKAPARACSGCSAPAGGASGDGVKAEAVRPPMAPAWASGEGERERGTVGIAAGTAGIAGTAGGIADGNAGGIAVTAGGNADGIASGPGGAGAKGTTPSERATWSSGDTWGNDGA